MIELLVRDRCVACNTCVTVCPNDVFDKLPGRQPVIARQADCVTCFICEAFCPADALYVGPQSYPDDVDEPTIVATGRLGSYRRALGWDTRQPGAAHVDPPGPKNPLPPPQANAWGIDRKPVSATPPLETTAAGEPA